MCLRESRASRQCLVLCACVMILALLSGGGRDRQPAIGVALRAAPSISKAHAAPSAAQAAAALPPLLSIILPRATAEPRCRYEVLSLAPVPLRNATACSLAYWDEHNQWMGGKRVRDAYRLSGEFAAAVRYMPGRSNPSAGGSGSATETRIVLLDDEAYFDCFHQDWMEGRDPAPLGAARAAAINAAMQEFDRSGPAPVLFVIIESSQNPYLLFPQTLPVQLHRIVLESGAVNPEIRPGGSYTIAPYRADVYPASTHGGPRDTLLFMKAMCRNGSTEDSIGIRMRWHVIHDLLRANIYNSPSIVAACSCGHCADATPHSQLLLEMASSTFCLVIAGDMPGSRRLSEIIATGCIPVFAGQPWHTLPLSSAVNYSAFALFYRFSSQPWLRTPVDHELLLPGAPWHLGPAERATLARVPIVDVVDTAALVAHLRRLPHDVVASLQTGVRAAQPYFVLYDPDRTLPSNAAENTLREVCRASGTAGGLG